MAKFNKKENNAKSNENWLKRKPRKPKKEHPWFGWEKCSRKRDVDLL